MLDFFDVFPEYSNDLYINKKMKTTPEVALESLKACLTLLEGLEPWNAEVLHEKLMELPAQLGKKNGQVLFPLRVAITGKQSTPGGAIELADIFGKEETLRRLRSSIAQLENMISPEHKIVRVMSNTPAMVGAAMTGICLNNNITEDEKKNVIQIFKALGRAELIDEHLIDAVVGISGSSPAYVYMFINALADGAVREGMSKNQAYIFAAQAVLGSAKMVLESGIHPGELIDMVMSPGGTTIEAVGVLEHSAFTATIIDAVHAAAEKNRSMAEDK